MDFTRGMKHARRLRFKGRVDAADAWSQGGYLAPEPVSSGTIAGSRDGRHSTANGKLETDNLSLDFSANLG